MGVVRRISTAVLVCLVAVAYANAGAAGDLGGDLDGQARFACAAGQTQPALCPTGRSGPQVARPADGRSGPPQAAPAGLLTTPGGLAAPASFGIRPGRTDCPRPRASVLTARLIRGPPTAT